MRSIALVGSLAVLAAAVAPGGEPGFRTRPSLSRTGKDLTVAFTASKGFSISPRGEVVTVDRSGVRWGVSIYGPDAKLYHPPPRYQKKPQGLGWPITAGASDKYIYVGDCLNHRVVRADKTWAAEETVGIK